jgi:hypothetical protein
MHKQQSQRDVVGEIAYRDWGTVTPIARLSTRSIQWKGVAFFRTSARPLRVEIVSNGRHEVVAIPDVQGQIIGALSMAFAAAVLLMTWLRRST